MGPAAASGSAILEPEEQAEAPSGPLAADNRCLLFLLVLLLLVLLAVAAVLKGLQLQDLLRNRNHCHHCLWTSTPCPC